MRRCSVVLVLIGTAVLAGALLSVRSAASAPLRAATVGTTNMAVCPATSALPDDASNGDSTMSCSADAGSSFAPGDSMICSVDVTNSGGHTITMDWLLNGSPVAAGAVHSGAVSDQTVYWEYKTQDPAITNGTWTCRVKVDGTVALKRTFTVVSSSTKAPLVAYVPFLDSLDPAIGYETDSWRILDPTCAGLVAWRDGNLADSRTLFPDAASAMPTISSDGLTYTFTIRPGMKFAPSGNGSVTPQSFVRAFERAGRVPGAGGGYFLDVVSGFDAYANNSASSISGVTVSGSQLKIKLTQKEGNFLARLAMPFFCAVPSTEPLTVQPYVPSAGPYYIASGASISTGAQLLLNPQYGGHRPHGASEIDVVVGTPQRYGIESGAADAGFAFSASDWSQIAAQFGSGGAKRAYQWPGQVVNQMTFDMAHSSTYLTQNVRKAIATGISRAALASTNGGVATSSLLSPEQAGYTGTGPYSLSADVATARSLMTSAGYSSSHHLALKLVTCLNSTCTARANALTSQLAQIYIDLTVEQVSNVYGTLAGTDWDIGLTGWQPDFPDPWDNLGPLFGTGAPANTSKYASSTFDASLAAADAKTGAGRASAFSSLATGLATGDVPATTYETFNDVGFYSTRVECVTYGAFGASLVLLNDKNTGAACDSDARES